MLSRESTVLDHLANLPRNHGTPIFNQLKFRSLEDFGCMQAVGIVMTKQLITVGHSPDPDDAFMFYALAHDKLDTGNLQFRHELQDIETLNRRALRGELEVTAVSIHAYAYLQDKYALLPSGCSMGDKYGPMVVARRPMTFDELKTVKIAVPGTMTTAFL